MNPIHIERTQVVHRGRTGPAWTYIYTVTVPGQPFPFTGDRVRWATDLAKRYAQPGQQIVKSWEGA